MKKYAFIILAAILLITAGLLYYTYQAKENTGNEEQNTTQKTLEKDTREIVWEQLPAQQKEEINGSWSDGEVSKTILSENTVMSTNSDTSYIGEEVYLISFPSKLNPTIGDLIVYADVDTAVIIGYGLRD
jgi:cell division protein FtsL